jgi:hypothetical protein
MITMKYKIEMTDTFAGELNYSWVKRTEFVAPADASTREIVRRTKAWAGLTGMRCKVDDAGGDMITIRPSGQSVVLFVTWS